MIRTISLTGFLIVLLNFHNYAQTPNEQKTITQLVTIYKDQGTKALRDYANSNLRNIGSEFIINYLAKNGQINRDTSALEIALIISKIKNDTISLAATYYYRGQYEYIIGNNEEAMDYYNKALPLLIDYGDIRRIGDVTLGQGDIYLYTGHIEEALKKYTEALNNFQSAKDTLGQGNVYLKEGILNFYTGNDEKALEMYSNALSLFQKINNQLGLGNVFLRQGEIFYYGGNNDKALESFSKALSFFQEAGDLIGQGNVYLIRGTVYSGLGNNQKALEMYTEALPLFKQAKYLTGQGNVIRSLGELYFEIGDNEKAKEFYLQALPVFQQSENLTGQGNIYMNLGNLYKLTGDYYKAEEMYSNALRLYEQQEDPFAKANIYLCKGDLFKATGNYEKALKEYSLALPLFELAGIPVGEGHVYKAYADIFLQTGDNDKALDMYSRALEIFKRLDDALDQANIYCRLGTMYLNVGDYQKSLEMNSNALLFFQQIQNPLGIANAYSGSADTYLKTEDFDNALKNYNSALQIYDQIYDNLGIGYSYIGIGECNFHTGNNFKAEEMYDKALLYFSKSDCLEGKIIAYMGFAKLYEYNSDKKNAFQSYTDAINLLEKLRIQTGFTEMKLSIQESLASYYEEAIRFMLKNGFGSTAFKYTEALKGRAFLDQLTEKNIGQVNKGLGPELKAQISLTNGKLSALKVELQNVKSDSIRNNIRNEIIELEDKLENVVQKIRFENPLYASVNYYSPIDVDSLQKYIVKPSEVLVEYFISTENVYAFIITKESFNIEKLPVSSHELINSSSHYISNYLIKSMRGTELISEYVEINECLIKPVLNYLQNKKELIIVPDAHLSLLPFEAIVIDYDEELKPHYLIEDFTIKYFQSATLLAFHRTHYKNENNRNSFIGFGDPVYDFNNYISGNKEGNSVKIDSNITLISGVKRDNYERSGGALTRLEGTGEEIKSIAQIFKENNLKWKVNIRSDAVEEKVKSNEMKDYGYISFACHGLLAGDFQCLALSQIPHSTEDGYLTIDEIMNLDWNAKLVVLSACQTGKGEFRKGEGIVGLTRAVMYAGTPAALVSLWSVSDEGTKDLMILFFKNLIEKGMVKEEALRQAKLEMLNSKFSEPFYWAAFVIYGE